MQSPASKEHLYLGLSTPSLITWSLSQSLSLAIELPETRPNNEENYGSLDITKVDRSIIQPRVVRFLLGRYDKCVRPHYPIPVVETMNDLEVPLKKLPYLEKFNVIISCAITAALESIHSPEWKVTAKVCREWAEELAPPIITVGDVDAVSAILSLLIYELVDPSRGIAWELIGLATRICLQLGWHKREDERNFVPAASPSNSNTTPSSPKNLNILVLKSIERYNTSLRLSFSVVKSL